jgi:hypothetical protein
VLGESRLQVPDANVHVVMIYGLMEAS